MRIAVVGAGAIGACFGALLAEAGSEVSLVARGRHLDAIRVNGLTVRRGSESRTLLLPASDIPTDLGPMDVVLFCVKLWSVEEAGEATRSLVGPYTMVVPLQNGIDALERLSEIVSPEHLVGGIAQISAVLESPGVVEHRSPFARMIVGELDGSVSERVRSFVEACTSAGIEARASEAIRVELWQKFVFIVGLSGATAFFRASIGAVRTDAETSSFLAQLVQEAVAVGWAEGIALPKDQVERAMETIGRLPEATHGSMRDDLERGSRLELPWLCGRVADLGRKHGVQTPANDMVVLALKLYSGGQG
jgi:2-dehydropantoate 2-reductase